MKNTNSNFISSSFGLSWLRASLNVAAFACASLLVITSLADAGGAQGVRVRRGNVSFSQDGNRLIVRASNGAIIEYDRLSVEAGQIMQFIQPGSRSRVLNRVTGSELTRIDGTMLSNGMVYLINPQGFRIGNGAVIKVGGFFAAAGAMSNSDFVAGRNRFTNLSGQVTNDGLIQAQAVALVGQYVANRGTIDVGNGYLAMGAGDSVVIQKGTGPVMVTVSRSQLGADGSGAGTQAAISNTGTINAGKGSVSMASGDFYALAMDLSGTIIGKSIAARGGKDGVVAVNGTVDASSTTGKGGTVDIFGDRVGLFGDALVNANGATGGGSIRIGGDYLGSNAANAPQASRTFIGDNARVTANATQSGDGGRVIVWSNEYTGFFGAIEASAAASGKGGFVETSSHDNLQAFGSVDASSALGQAGTWLLDPSDVVIAAGSAGSLSAGVFDPVGSPASIGVVEINAALNAGTSVIINTASAAAGAGNITMTGAISKTAGGDATLTLNAVGTIVLSQSISSTLGELSVALNAGGSVTMDSIISTNGGKLTIVANGAVTQGALSVLTIGDTTTITAGAANDITLDNANNFGGDVTIVSANNVTLSDIVITAGSFTQLVGTGTTNLNGLVTLTGALDLNGTIFNIAGGVNAGGLVSITNSGVLTTTSAIVAGGGFTQDGGGANSLGGNITTTDDAISFATDVTLTSGVLLNTVSVGGGNNITVGARLSGTVAGAQTLGLTAGSGNIVFGSLVGGGATGRLGAITITSANDVTAAGIIAASLQQIAGTGTTNFNGPQNYNAIAGLNVVTGGTIALNNTVTTTNSGTVTLTGTTAVTIAVGGDITSDGAVNFTSTGGISTAGDVTTTNDVVNFNSATTLTGAVLVSTAGGDINFAAALTGPQALTLESFAGNITFGGAVGAVALTSILINDANNVTAGVITAGSFTQLVGTGTTNLNGLVTLTGALDLNGTIFNIAGGVNAGGLVSITNSGVLTTTSAIVAGGGFTQDGGGANSLGGNITTTDDAISFATDVTLTSGVLLNTVSVGGGNNITVGARLSGTVAVAQTLGLTAGSGNIVFGSLVGGGATGRLGAITITSANDVTAAGIIAASLQQIAGTGTTNFNGPQNYNAIAGLNVVTGGTIALNNTVTTTNSGTVTLTGTTAVTIAVGGDITSDGAVNFTSTGGISTAGDVTTTNDVVNFNSATTLTGAVLVSTAGGDINFAAALTGPQALTLESFAGDITFGGAVGAVALTSILINDANNVTAGVITAGSFTQLVGTGTTNLNGLVTLTGALDLNGTIFNIAGGVNAGGLVSITNSGVLTTTSAIVAGGGFTQDGGGANSLGGNITTTDDAISFATDVTLTSGVLLNTVSVGGGNNITVGARLSGTVAGAQTLGLTAGSGNIVFGSLVGGGATGRLGAITITSANDVTAAGIIAASLQQIAGTGTTNFNGPQNYNAIAGLNVVTGGTIALNNTVTTTNSGTVTLTGTTAVTIAVGGDITSDGAVNFTSTGGISTAGDVTTTNDVVNFNSATTLTGAVLVSTAGGDINFAAALTGPQALTLESFAGNITFGGAVGAVALTSILINDANNVTAGVITAGSFTQLVGTGTTNLNGLVTLTGALDLNGTIFNIAGGVNAGGLVSITNSGVLTTTSAIVAGGGFTQDGGGANSLGGNITTTDDAISFATDVTLTSGVLLNTVSVGGGNNITVGARLSGTVAVAQTLGLTAGSGNIVFGSLVGGGATGRLGAITITSANDVTAAGIIAASLQQIAGTGTTNFNGPQNYNAIAGLNVVTGGTIALNNTVTTTNSGTVTLTGTTAVTIAVGGDITSDGAVNFTSTGGISTAGDVTTTNDVVNFNSATTLTGAVLVSTAGGDINFAAALTGPQALTLESFAGNITFGGAVGAVALTSILINDANNVTAGVITAGSFTQLVGTGTTNLNGLVTLTGALDLNGTIFNIAGGVNAGGLVSITNSGVLTTTSAIVAGGGFTQDGGGANSLGGNITTTDDAISFATDVTLTSGVLLNTVSVGGGNNITVGARLSGTVAGAQTLGLTAGSGNIVFGSLVGGGATGRLGAITITSANDVTAAGIIAASLQQIAGTGTTNFNGPQNYNAIAGLNVVTGGTIALNNTVTTTNSGTVTLTGTTAVTIAVGGDITSDGAVNFTSTGGISTAGNVTTTNDVVNYNSATVLTGNVLVNTGAGIGNINYFNTLNGTFDLGLNAGTGNILFVGAVGAANALGNVTVTSAASVTFNSSFAAASYTQTGSGDATYNGLLNLSGAFSFIGNALTLNGVGTNLVGTTMTVTNAGLFTTANGADLSVGDAMLQNGTGSNSIGGDIASTRDAIGFATGVTLTNGVTMTTGAGAGDDISYGSTVDGLFDLSVIAGNGDVFFDAAVGSIAPLASLTVVSADLTTHFAGNVTTVGDQLFNGAASIDSDVTFTATDTLANITFNGAINNGGILPSNMFVDAGGNVIFNGNIGAVSALGIFSANSGNDLGETITFGEFGSGFFDPTANFEVSAESVQLNTGATSTLAAPATIATIASQSDVGITFNTDDFAMGQNHKLTSYGAIEISGLTGTSATSVTLGDVNAVGDFTVDSGSINLLARSGGQILTNTGGTTNDPMVDVVVGGRVYFSTAPVMIGSGKTAAFSNPTGNVDGSGTLGNFAKTVYPSAITRSLLTGLGGEVLDLSASSVVSYTNPATLLPSPMPILPAIGILGNSDTLDEAKDKEKAKAVEEAGTKKTASESNPAPTGIPVASR